ncbi:hypothetical protein GGR92_000336 [Spirosoma lacussanchae]|uniref:hypothetical protein n=1 Tax=Spirosoma lacussanchae TaxID=1884249 RepID=UPI0011089EFE|nr:hypothetical protein [Spirosoma lacussanchae]
MKKIVFGFLLLGSHISSAQYDPLGAITSWADGYVVSHQGDTLAGQVRVGSVVNDSPTGIVIRLAGDKRVKMSGDELRTLVQQIPDFAYVTGGIPRDRKTIVFERVPNPRRGGRPMLLERLTPAGGPLALYFDVSGWKRTIEYSFGNFTISHRRDLSCVVVKIGQPPLIARPDNLEAVHDAIFGYCPEFIQNYPLATRRDWDRFGEMVVAYNQLCALPY